MTCYAKLKLLHVSPTFVAVAQLSLFWKGFQQGGWEVAKGIQIPYWIGGMKCNGRHPHLKSDFGIQLNTEILKFHLFINNLYQLSMYQSIYIKLYQGYYVTKINLL